MTTLNIRNSDDRNTLIKQGWTWVCVVPRGENKGSVVSKHRSYDRANQAAKGRDIAIKDIANAWTY